MRSLIFLSFLLGASAVFAQENFGYSYLGICHPSWPCDLSIDAYKEASPLRLSFLYDRTFGDDCSCIRKFYQDSREKITRIHLTNGPGLRNKRLQVEEVFYGHSVSSAQTAILNDDPDLKAKFEEVARRAAKDYESSVGFNSLYVSTCLECDFSALTRSKLIEWARPFFPNAKFVDNPLKGACLPNTICEKHGTNHGLVSNCFADLDGKDFQSVDLKSHLQKYNSCKASYIWGYKFNLLDSKSPNFVAPRLRKEAPDADYFESIQRSLK